jgi:hypothetical protein
VALVRVEAVFVGPWDFSALILLAAICFSLVAIFVSLEGQPWFVVVPQLILRSGRTLQP